MKKPRRFPTSGDRNVDWEFRQLIRVLDREVEAIRKKKVLRDPDDRRKFFRGLLMHGKEIYLSSHKKDGPIVKTLIHEAAHLLYPCVPNRYIYEKEEILWKRFTDEQKRLLRSYIPKHHSTAEPISEPPDNPQ
jgi:hypothetical protein